MTGKRAFETIGMVGAGNMARALVTGWKLPVLCTDAGSGRAAALAEELGGTAVASNAELAARADLIVLCHKPAQLTTVAAEIDGSTAVVVSVLSGVSVSELRAAYRRTQVIRLTANLPVQVRAGVLGFPTGQDVDARTEDAVIALFGSLGTLVRIPEQQVAALIPLVGIGPALVSVFAEAHADAAIGAGLPADLATVLSTATLRGTAALLAAYNHDTLALRRAVASPGGPTARSLAALEEYGLRRAVLAAVRQARPAPGPPPSHF